MMNTTKKKKKPSAMCLVHRKKEDWDLKSLGVEFAEPMPRVAARFIPARRFEANVEPAPGNWGIDADNRWHFEVPAAPEQQIP